MEETGVVLEATLYDGSWEEWSMRRGPVEGLRVAEEEEAEEETEEEEAAEGSG